MHVARRPLLMTTGTSTRVWTLNPSNNNNNNVLFIANNRQKGFRDLKYNTVMNMSHNIPSNNNILTFSSCDNSIKCISF